MQPRLFLLIISGALAGSFFLPWLNGGLAEFRTPKAIFDAMPKDDLTAIPPVIMVFLGTFALAALVAGMALLGFASRILTLFAGVIPICLFAYAWAEFDAQRQAMGIPELSLDQWEQIWEALQQAFSTGFFVYAGASVLLLLTGLFGSFGRR
jgi:hypothetical protein